VNWQFAFIAILGSAIFGWHAWQGVSAGKVRFPVQILGEDEYDREHTLFWGIVGSNIILSVGLLCLAAYLFLEA
jgi:hypothetical protein